MTSRKNIFVINGSASENSANQRLVDHLVHLAEDDFHFTIFNSLQTLPHFDATQSLNDPPPSVINFRNAIDKADGVIICTPEYIFSIPSGLKNAVEWCVATTVFLDKPAGLITASAEGSKGHAQLQLIMKTLMAKFTDATTLLIQGVRGKLNALGEITDLKTREDLNRFIVAFKNLVNET